MPLNTIPNKGLTSRGYPSDRLVTPIIINGDMSVAQRGTSSSGVTGGGYTSVDRMVMFQGIGTFTFSQSTTVPTGQGFAKSFKADCTTAEASPGSADVLIFAQKIEGQNLQMIKKGTSNAEQLTASFWVRSNKTGTYTLEIKDLDNTRNVSQTYTINSADTWEKKVVAFPADTTGAFDNDNGASFQIHFWLGAGSDYTSGTLSTSWASQTNANRVSSSQVNIGDSTDNEWYITGVQLEVGEFDSTTIPSFPFESHESNLRKCQRYFFTYTGTTQEWVYKENNNANGSWAWLVIPHHMRTAPTITFDSGWTGGSVEGLSGTISSLAVQDNDQYRASLRLTMSSGQSGNGYQLHHTDSWSNDVASFSAEL